MDWTVERVQALAAELVTGLPATDGDADYSVYAWFRRGECIYVGVSNNPDRRRQKHVSGARTGRHDNSRLGRTLVKSEREGTPCEFVVLTGARVTRETAYALEAALVTKIGRKELGSGPLLNADEGGVGPTLECCRKGAAAAVESGRLAHMSVAGTVILREKMRSDPEIRERVLAGGRAGGRASGRAAKESGRLACMAAAGAAALNERRRAAALAADEAKLASGEWTQEQFDAVRRRRDQKRARHERVAAECRADPAKAEAYRQRQREWLARRRAAAAPSE